jgi:hypothetical protein
VNEALIALVIFVLGLAFAAGGYVFALASARKQINGLGARLNRAVAALIHICPDEKREEIVLLVMGLKKDDSHKP